MIDKTTFKLLSQSHTCSDIDDFIIQKYQKDNLSLKDIAETYPNLLGSRIIDAIKKVAKILLANNIEPDLSREWASDKVMGWVGESLTELIIPGDYVKPGNPGFDIKFNDELIEIKTSVETKFSLSKKQYETANFLVTHRFHVKSGYIDSYFYPLEIVKMYKPLAGSKKRQTASVDLVTDEWSPKYKISLASLSKFFKLIERYMDEGLFHQVVCYHCLKNCERFDAQVIEERIFGCEQCRDYGSSQWHDRYCNLYIRRRAKIWYNNKNKNMGCQSVGFYWRPKKYGVRKTTRKYPSRIMANVVW
ncbi:hypothetical protein ACEUKD_09005 [Vibrio diabolicus]|uniref:hypothetical protein n=1 Tax=Vibrio diabolicus TaxID=50719 RepID=UPI0035A895CA